MTPHPPPPEGFETWLGYVLCKPSTKVEGRMLARSELARLREDNAALNKRVLSLYGTIGNLKSQMKHPEFNLKVRVANENTRLRNENEQLRRELHGSQAQQDAGIGRDGDAPIARTVHDHQPAEHAHADAGDAQPNGIESRTMGAEGSVRTMRADVENGGSGTVPEVSARRGQDEARDVSNHDVLELARLRKIEAAARDYWNEGDRRRLTELGAALEAKP